MYYLELGDFQIVGASPEMLVRVENGVVELSGEVDRKSDILVLCNMIGGLDGVVGVGEHLHYRYDDTRASYPLVAWSPFGV